MFPSHTSLRINNKNVIECQICRFSNKDQSTFLNHIQTKKHQAAVEQLSHIQAQANRPEKVQAVHPKRPAAYELDESEAFEVTNDSKSLIKKNSVLVSYQDDGSDDNEEEEKKENNSLKQEQMQPQGMLPPLNADNNDQPHGATEMDSIIENTTNENAQSKNDKKPELMNIENSKNLPVYSQLLCASN